MKWISLAGMTILAATLWWKSSHVEKPHSFLERKAASVSEDESSLVDSGFLESIEEFQGAGELGALGNHECERYLLSLDLGTSTDQGGRMVDWLVSQNVPVLLFMVGRNLKTGPYQEILEKIRDPKSSYSRLIMIGNHTQTHRGFANLPGTEIRDEITGAETSFKEAGIPEKNFARVFRFPKAEITPDALKIVGNSGYEVLGWSVETADWIPPYDPNHKDAKTVRYYKRVTSPWGLASFVKKQLSIETPVGGFTDAQIESAINKAGLWGKPIPGITGPSAERIKNSVLSNHCNDSGLSIPLLHFSGENTFEAIQSIIPALRESRKKLVSISSLTIHDAVESSFKGGAPETAGTARFVTGY